MKKQLVVIGNGMAGIRLVEDVLGEFHSSKTGSETEQLNLNITIIGEEPGTAYNRILLSLVLGGEKSTADAVFSWDIFKDGRIWILFIMYGACFGVELTVNNVAALYFSEKFDLGLASAGAIAGLFGLMNTFGRSFGGYLSDLFAVKEQLRGRVNFLFVTIVLEGLAMIVFAQMDEFGHSIAVLIFFSLTVQMAEGAVFAIVPMIRERNLGLVAGVVGAGGDVGAVGAGFLFRAADVSYQDAFLTIGYFVFTAGALVPLINVLSSFYLRQRLISPISVQLDSEFRIKE